MADAFAVVRQFEAALCEYTGAPYAVAVNSCSSALLLALVYAFQAEPNKRVRLPRRTYVSVPMAVKIAGGSIDWRDEAWLGAYRLDPFAIWDSARWFTSGLYRKVAGNRGGFVCVSFHHSKTLGDTQGGAILHNDPAADAWLRRARFDGRTEGVAPKDDTFDMLGYHCYLSPDVAARLMWKLSKLPLHNAPLPSDDYPDLSLAPLFR